MDGTVAMASTPLLAEKSDGEGSSSSSSMSRRTKLEYFGWVYHLGTNKIGHEFCHLRFLFIRGKYVEMYKRDPHHNPGIRPIGRGVVGHTLMVEEAGCRKVNNGDLYVLRFYNRLDESQKGEIACGTAGETRKWIEAFDQAKQQAEYELSMGASASRKLTMEEELNLEGHRPRVRRYAYGLKKLIRIGEGPETLLRRSSGLIVDDRSDGRVESDSDAVEAQMEMCLCNEWYRIRIFEDVADSKGGKDVLVKSVGVINSSADTVFEVLLSLEPSKRYEWDMLTSELELIESLDGHYDVLYGKYDPKYLPAILHFPAVHKKKPEASGYRCTKIIPSTWEVKVLSPYGNAESPSCLLTHMLEIKSSSWCRWKKSRSSKFEKSIPFALLCQVAGLKEYINANPALALKSPTSSIDSKTNGSVSNSDYEDMEVADEFYDAIAASMSDDDEDDEDSDVEIVVNKKDHKVKLKNVAWAIAGLSLKPSSAQDAHKGLDSATPSVPINLSEFHGSFRPGKYDTDTNCWTSPDGTGFMIREKSYLKDCCKVRAGDPLLKLIAVDWIKSESSIDNIALRPFCIVQSEAGKKLPFILVNLQVPAKPNYNMVFYYAADKPMNKSSLLGKFVDGTDAFRDSRFKLIPSIVKGYWMVKRAVGTKACLLGKAVTCRYLRQDNFLEIDVDIGSSSVARSVIGLVLGYVTTLVVDLAILLEAKEEEELPEYLLGTVRLNCVKLESAVEV